MVVIPCISTLLSIHQLPLKMMGVHITPRDVGRGVYGLIEERGAKERASLEKESRIWGTIGDAIHKCHKVASDSVASKGCYREEEAAFTWWERATIYEEQVLLSLYLLYYILLI